MAKQSGLGDNVWVGGYDLSGDITSMDQISGGPALLEATVVKQVAHARLFGQRDASWKFTTMFENTPTISTPGFPASTTPVTNTNNVTVFVTITGGTLTSVVVNGTQVGTTAGTYQVPAGGTIAITYSVAPTWSWFALGSEHNSLAPLPRTDVNCIYARGTAVSNPAACLIARQVNYDGTRDNKGNLTFQIEMDADSFGMEWGNLLTAGIRTDTAATVGSFVDQLAGTAFGAQAYLQIFDLVGTSIDITITHCATSGGTYTTLFDFGSITPGQVPQAQRLAVANNTTVNEFIKVTTTGTFSFAQFAVVMNRNTIAGQVF